MKQKRQFAKAVQRKAKRGFRGYPLATVALYGPDDRQATKLAVGIVVDESDEPVDLRRWLSETSDLREDPVVEKERGPFEPALCRQVFDQHRLSGHERVAGLRPLIGWDRRLTERHIGAPSPSGFENQRLAGLRLMKDLNDLDVEGFCDQFGGQIKEAIDIQTAQGSLCEVCDYGLRGRVVGEISRLRYRPECPCLLGCCVHSVFRNSGSRT